MEAAHRLGSRISMNIQTLTEEMMRRISPHKGLAGGILEPTSWVHNLNWGRFGGSVGEAA